jgi:SNF2 family DNA or RNA helicase
MIFDASHNVLIYPALARGTSDLILQHIPEARQFNGSSIGVPRTLRNSQVLRWLGHAVTPIITDQNYDWPIEPGLSPLLHQKIYANFQALHPRCFNLGDPGTMKTLSSLWAADWLMRQHPPGEFRVLIICPLTIIETVWATGVFRNFLGRRSFEILHGTSDKRRKLLAKKPDFALINFDGVGVDAHTRKGITLDGFSKELAERDDIKLVIVDEARGYGDASTTRNKIARLSIGKKPYLWQLSGSPTPNKPTDCYGMAKLCNNAFGKSFQTFQQDTMLKVSNFVWKPQKDGYETARRMLVPAVRFTLDEIWQGPPQTIQQREVELSEPQKRAMAELKRDMQILMDSGQVIDAINEAAFRQKLFQISLGAIYDRHHREHLIDSAPRLKELEQIISSTQRKVVIFVPLTSVIHLLYRHLKKKHGCVVINGEVPQKQRAGIIRQFAEDEKTRIMITDPGTTAHGVNEFVVADTGVWYGAVDKADHWKQGNDRIRRPGQKYPSTIFQIVSNQTEKEIFKRLETNTSMQGLMLEAVKRGDF